VSPFRDEFAGSFYAKKQRHDERLPTFFGLSGYAYTERAKRARKKEKGLSNSLRKPSSFVPRRRLCRNRKEAVNIVMPVKTGIQNMLKILDFPVSSTRQAQSRASLALKK
jgi:hypothetical protein